MSRPDYLKFASGRVNFVEPSPIRDMVSKIAAKSRSVKVISFAAGEPDPDVVPRGLYGELMRELFSSRRLIASYSPTDGIPELKEEIAGFMERHEGVKTSPGRIVATLGGSQAIDLLGKMFLDPGDIVLVENPSYVNTLLVWKHYGVKLVGVDVDDQGLRPDLLEDTLRRLRSDGKKVKLLYTIPTGQNPSGITMSMDRRKKVVELASEHDFLVVEDTAYNHLVYEPVEAKPLRSMDSEGRVIYVGSFSKVLGTGLRIGWIEAPEEIVEKLKAMKGPADMCPPVPSQYLVTEVLKRGLFPEIRDKAIIAYREKRDLMLKAIKEQLPGLRHTRPVAGMFILLWLPDGIDAWSFADKLLEEHNVATIPAPPFYLDEKGRSVLRLNFSMAEKDLIYEGVERIRKLLDEMGKWSR